MSYVNRFQKGSDYQQGEEERVANAGGTSREYSKRRESLRPKSVELGKEYEVEITEKSRREDGVARVDNFVVFVRNGRVGEKVKIKIDSVSENYATASIVPNPQPASSTP
jgi:predicted RNA-binding protein with TRAM domain